MPTELHTSTLTRTTRQEQNCLISVLKQITFRFGSHLVKISATLIEVPVSCVDILRKTAGTIP